MSPVSILPLGGCGEIGLNATLIIDGDDALLIDCGVRLGVFGTDRVLPDFGPILNGRFRLHGLVLTHGHEDHIGGVGALLEAKKLDVHGTPLALDFLRAKLEDQPSAHALLEERALGETARIGPFEVELIRVTHSIPDSAALAIRTSRGLIVHSGDFKLDHDPIDDQRTDVERLRALGDEGVSLLLADSTNAERPGRTTPERAVGAEIEQIVEETAGLAVVCCFSSHIHRLRSVLSAAKRSGRKVCFVGRSLDKSFRIARDHGLLKWDDAHLIDERRLGKARRSETLLVVTGTQGEPFAGLSRLVRGELETKLAPGDVVILSATRIPGNEVAVRRVVNAILRSGAQVVQDGMRAVHCSGHAHQDEQRELLELLRPRAFVPVHGDRAMLEAHAKTARAVGVEDVLVIENGQSAICAEDGLAVGDATPLTAQPFDGSGAALTWQDVGLRSKISTRGLVVCSLVMGPSGPVDVPKITALGISIPAALEASMLDAIRGCTRGSRASSLLEQEIRAAIRSVFRNRLRRPIVEVHVLGA